MNAEIIAVGTEILLGDIMNTHAQFLAKELAALGFDLHFQSVVGDNRERLVSSLKESLDRSDIVILTGGLGPTNDDLTKETACELLGENMELNQEALDRIRRYFSRRGQEKYRKTILSRQCFLRAAPCFSTITERRRVLRLKKTENV